MRLICQYCGRKYTTGYGGCGCLHIQEYGAVRNSDPDTAHMAAARTDSLELNEEFYQVLVSHKKRGGAPMCVAEIHKLYLPHWSVDAVGPRPAQCRDKGWIIYLPKRYRINRYDNMRPQLVYEPVIPRPNPPPYKSSRSKNVRSQPVES